MADTSAQLEVARWINKSFLPERFGVPFSRERVRLSCGGEHEFAAVSSDRKYVGSITTGSATTARGKLGVGKLTKARADIYFLLLANASVRFLAVTDESMFRLLLKEQIDLKRIPAEIQIHHVQIPADLKLKLRDAQQDASDEVSPY